MINDEFVKSSTLEYEDCDMEVENVNESGVNSSAAVKKESDSNNCNEVKEDGEVKASTSSSNLFFNELFESTAQRHKGCRESKILETSIANLKKKLQIQDETDFESDISMNEPCGVQINEKLRRLRKKLGQNYVAVNSSKVGSIAAWHREPLDISSRTTNTNAFDMENCLHHDDEVELQGQTAVERSLAAMSKSKCSTSSRNSVNDIDDEEDGGELKSDAIMERIFGESNVTLSAALRRKRQRRNPVWTYFVVEEGLATCKYCNYCTKSVFSTNLKVHLRTHHRDLFEEVIKAEEGLQEHNTVQNSLWITDSTTSAATPKTPYMHHVTTTALPALGSSDTSSSANLNSNAMSNGTSTLSNAAVLLGILNQGTGFQPDSTVSVAATAANNSSTFSARIPALPTSQSMMDFPKALPEMQIPVNCLKPSSDLTLNLPDFLKVISEAAAKSATTASLNSAKMLTNDGSDAVEKLKSESKTSQSSSPTCNITCSNNKMDKNASQASSQSAMVLKRRRLRRHPVWRFFKDVGDGSKTVKCVNCSFSTSSPFSTNLKMHLKAHHKSDYRLILILESRQRLEEGISPIPESGQSSQSVGKRTSTEDPNISSADEEQIEAKRRSLSASTGHFEDDRFKSMTNTERVKAMIEMAAASHTPTSVNLSEYNADFTNFDEINKKSVFGSEDTSSNLVDTNLLARLGLVKSEAFQPKPPLQNKFLNTQTVNAENVIRSHLTSPSSLSVALDTTKSVRTVSKRLPTGEVVKVRQTRKNVDKTIVHLAVTTSVAAAATATISTTKPIVPSRDFSVAATADEGLAGIRAARDIALAKFLFQANAFHLLELPEFKQFVDSLNPAYEIPQSDYLKRLLQSSAGDHDLSPEHLLDLDIEK
ncbi:unnamed protein product [Thelazia callipaeda]|uniref:BED-type domain-containing protein n=1 Tax=Thelazia callipaeda TaxID=103827 RepID=A0A0N5D1R0_THECL|nr:unnamed protein product [Thelazia callipaeda]